MILGKRENEESEGGGVILSSVEAISCQSYIFRSHLSETIQVNIINTVLIRDKEAVTLVMGNIIDKV